LSPLPIGLLLTGSFVDWLNFLIHTLKHITELHYFGENHFSRLLLALAPTGFTRWSRPFSVGSYRQLEKSIESREVSKIVDSNLVKGLKIEDLLIVVGFVIALNFSKIMKL